MPLVSIITPLYNSESSICGTYASIEQQTFSDWEWIVIDDCSSDGSAATAEQLVKSDNRIKLLRNDVNGGAAKARNLGIQAAKGRYIAFLDADDSWAPDKLERQLKFMSERSSPYSFTSYHVVLEGNNHSEKTFVPRYSKATYSKLLHRNDIGCSTVICDREIIGDFQMNEAAVKREDYACWLELARKGFIGELMDAPLTFYRLSKNSVSHNKAEMLKLQWNVFRNIEKLGFLHSSWLLVCHVWNKLFKGY